MIKHLFLDRLIRGLRIESFGMHDCIPERRIHSIVRVTEAGSDCNRRAVVYTVESIASLFHKFADYVCGLVYCFWSFEIRVLEETRCEAGITNGVTARIRSPGWWEWFVVFEVLSSCKAGSRNGEAGVLELFEKRSDPFDVVCSRNILD